MPRRPKSDYPPTLADKVGKAVRGTVSDIKRGAATLSEQVGITSSKVREGVRRVKRFTK